MFRLFVTRLLLDQGLQVIRQQLADADTVPRREYLGLL